MTSVPTTHPFPLTSVYVRGFLKGTGVLGRAASRAPGKGHRPQTAAASCRNPSAALGHHTATPAGERLRQLLSSVARGREGNCHGKLARTKEEAWASDRDAAWATNQKKDSTFKNLHSQWGEGQCPVGGYCTESCSLGRHRQICHSASFKPRTALPSAALWWQMAHTDLKHVVSGCLV